jgi:hypothetical protein
VVWRSSRCRSPVKKKAAEAKAGAKTRHEEHVQKLSRFAAQQKESFRELFA